MTLPSVTGGRDIIASHNLGPNKFSRVLNKHKVMPKGHSAYEMSFNRPPSE